MHRKNWLTNSKPLTSSEHATGVDVPIFYKGKQVGTRKRYSDSLLMFLLKSVKPEMFYEVARAPRLEREARERAYPNTWAGRDGFDTVRQVPV